MQVSGTSGRPGGISVAANIGTSTSGSAISTPYPVTAMDTINVLNNDGNQGLFKSIYSLANGQGGGEMMQLGGYHTSVADKGDICLLYTSDAADAS